MQAFRFTIAVFFSLTALTGCEKNLIVSTDPIPTEGEELRAGAFSCTDLSYADTVFYLREQQEDYIVSPVKAVTGIYGAFPAGLRINPVNGDINVTKSETGLRYKVFHIRLGTNDTCSRYVTISGVDYRSSLFVLSRNDTLLRPIYNGRSYLEMPCAGSSSNPNVSSTNCDFDNGDPVTGQQLSSQGIAIDRSNGNINLKRTVQNGLFGISPVNGTARIFRLYYRINDASKKALNHMDVKFIYYDKLTNVPNTLITRIRTQNARLAAPGKGGAPSVGYATTDTGGRPPDIVVTGVE